ncbi:MAG: toll/interleukin-1 receptor domain-containing protein [Rhodospirillales bacterium]|nr:toll/interleukin-1 receptor domain-containing protein [Rhodospirillales bacterium]
MARDVFISYSSKDKPTADAACAKLEERGIRCWIAPRDILPGADWSSSIIDAINGARAMVLVFSANANASQQIKREVERVVHKGIPIIPLRIENVAPENSLEYFISTPHWLDAFSPPLEHHLAYLADVIRHILEGIAVPAPPPPPPPPWWRDRRGAVAGAALLAGAWQPTRYPGAPGLGSNGSANRIAATLTITRGGTYALAYDLHETRL